MAADKQRFEPHAGKTVSLALPSGKAIRLEPGDVYETSDTAEIGDLSAHPAIKTAETAAAATKDKD